MLRTRRTLRTPAELAEAGLVPASQLAALADVAGRYATAIPPHLAELIDPDDPADPIARQFVPRAEEREIQPQERADPIGDERHSPVAGIVHRYPDRVLLKLTQLCPVYCRFCFRREMVGPEKEGLGAGELEAALGYIAARPEIWEVVVTGGDPLILAPRRLAELTRRLGEMDHVRILRWHTRVPVAAPESVTAELVGALKSSGQASYVVLHANHPRELTAPARAACARLIDGGVPMLSQSVLLRGVNDRIEVLEALMRALVETRIRPYYLHHPDLAPGTAHFRLTIAEGQALVRALHARASGLCQPVYVLDIPGGHTKAKIAEADISGSEDGHLLRDAGGSWHSYRDTPR